MSRPGMCQYFPPCSHVVSASPLMLIHFRPFFTSSDVMYGSTNWISVGRSRYPVWVTTPIALPCVASENPSCDRHTSDVTSPGFGSAITVGVGVTGWRVSFTYRTTSTGIIATSCAIPVTHDQNVGCDIAVGTSTSIPAPRRG